jgi:hypothetical protein
MNIVYVCVCVFYIARTEQTIADPLTSQMTQKVSSLQGTEDAPSFIIVKCLI